LLVIYFTAPFLLQLVLL